MSRPYGRVTESILEELAGIVGRPNCLTDPESLALYSRDETEDLSFPPEVVVRPGSTEQVARIMKVAARERIPVTPRGGGTGLSGGALPVRGGMSLSLARMDRILEIDTDNLMAVAEPGVITEVLQNEVAKVGLYYPPDPASRGSCLIGGNVAENAAGPHAVKYGVTRDWVSGLEAVTAGGAVFTCGGKLRKDASGYSLTHLLVGSEGTLAVITRVIVKLIPAPAHRRALAACFDSVEAAARTVVRLFDRKVTPAAVDSIIRRRGLRAICYGHAGDGNIHVNILKDEGGAAWAAHLDTAVREIFGRVAALGGKISGEHGIGWAQRDYMAIAHSAVELDLMRRIKAAFDPDGILNPGKILPD